jgi:hypothetical protein
MDLIYEFGADVTQFNASIADVTKEIKKLKDVLKTATGAEIPKLNAEIAALQTSLSNLKSVGTPAATAFAKVEDSAKGARIALTNVSQIAQDLPFGFIGIQNNIPGLIQSFGKLSTESGGAVAALKAMGSALIGPAGIFLAFSLATAAVTAIIQKYGSLGNALTVLFSKNKLLATSQLEYNKALEEGNGRIGGEIGQITVLVDRLNNLSLSNKDRLAAYFELGKIAPEIIANIEKENALTANSITLINLAAKARIEYIKLKVQENAITSVLDKTQLEVIKRETELGVAKRKTVGFEQELLKVQKDPISRTRALREAQLTNSIEAQNIVVSKAREELFKTYNVQNSYYKLLDPVIGKIAEYDLANQKVTKTLENQEKTIKAPKQPKGRAGLFDYLVTEVDKSLIPISKLQGKLDNLLKPKISPFRLQAPTQNPLQAQLDALKQFVLKSEEARKQLKDFFFDPVNALFTNFFETGKFTIKAFGDVLLAQVKKIVAELLTSKILSLLANLIPGVGAGSAALKAGGAIGKFIGMGGNLLGRGAANFSGVQSGGLGMSGSVNLTLRGTDLVGAINRTNSQISRVG